ncbi:hypothetical protein IKE67_04975 [bacterium]|nr:hypothetical protein [bacterium]
MAISSNIDNYLQDSKIKGQLCKWDKPFINVFITEITANISDKPFLYSEIERAIAVWNKVLKENNFPVLFNKINTPVNADVVIHWTKVGRVFEGMCKYPSIINGIFKKIIIDIGLPNEFSGKNTTNESIFATILHELGHSLGLGHGVDVNDAMFVPHQKNIAFPSENDLYVLKKIYNN